FVLPSVSEPFGIVPLEAMAFGAATIVSKQSGVAEVVNNVFKVNFWDVDRIADTIVGLLDDPVKRQKIAEAGQKEVFAMGWNNAARNLKRSYEEILCSM
ncbi:glycosyltransferase family 4 protein, partial [bacterium]|nr:glycosyltransferase family 4 protein [bacterium]